MTALPTEQKLFFAEEMRPVSEVVECWLANGKDRSWIFRQLGFRLGLTKEEEGYELDECKEVN